MDEQTPPGGIYYEPRSLWTIYNGDELEGSQPANESDFRNAGKYPITVTRMAIASANQIFDYPDSNENAAFAPPTISTLLNTRFQEARVPFRQNYTKRPTKSATFRPKPTAEPSTRLYNSYDPVTGSLQPIAAPGPLFGQVRLNFDFPVYLPRTGSIEAQLSSLDDWSQMGVGNILLDSGLEEVNASIAYMEAGGLFAGSARVKNVPVPVRAAEAARATAPSGEGWPYALPVGEAVSNVGFPVTDNGKPFWDPQGRFGASEFNRQEATRAGSTKILGISVAFDELAYSARCTTPPFFGDGAVAPLSQRIGCGFTTVNGVSGDAWWRPGAPCALVLDSITPALVYDLVEPITLDPGAVLEMEDLIDPETLILLGGGGGRPRDNFALGVAFNGFAAIKG
jgi:hypothetical protein